MVAPIVQRIPTRIPVPGKPLGRNRLINWREIVRALVRTPGVELRSVSWTPNNPIALDQNDLGACTGFAAAHTGSTAPYTWRLTAEDARAIYSDATERDPFPGSWPPDDTGSTGWAAFSAAVDLGCFSGFSMTDGVDELCEALQTRPGAIGVDWYEGMDSPSEDGQIRPTGQIRGGHEIEVLAVDMAQRYAWIRNSWGPRWGVTHEDATGCAWISLDDLALLLESGGDATFPNEPEVVRGGVGIERAQRKTLASAFETREALRVCWYALFGKKPSDGALCVLLAQWALETARGEACWNWNLGNAKYPSARVKQTDGSYVETVPLGSRGDWQWYPAGEVRKDGTEYTIYPPDRGACWMAYATLLDGASAYLAFLRRRYRPAWEYLATGNAAGFSHRLKQLGYYTASEAKYTRGMVSLCSEFAAMPKSLRLGEPGFRVRSRANVIAGIKRWQQIVGSGVDGKFGTLTEAKTKDWQRSFGFSGADVDGVAGPMSWAKALGNV